MNANRMKYASTPTYGLQKRSMLNKKASAWSKTTETPDFSQAPDEMSGMLSQPLFSTQTQPPAYSGGSFAAPSPWFPQGTSIPPMQSMPSVTPYGYPMGGMQPPSMAGAAMPPMSGAGMPLFGAGMRQAPMGGAMLPGMQGQMQNQISGNMPPMGNSVPPVPQNAGFSARNQGFVPSQPQAQPQVQAQAQPMSSPFQGGAAARGFGQPMGMPFQAASPAPAVQPAAFMGGGQAFNNAAFGGAPPMNVMPVQGMGFTPENANPYFNTAASAPFQPMQVNQASPTYGGQAQGRFRTPMDMDKLWFIFLFGLLPLLFIPCIFVPQSWNFIRYLFLVLSVCGMGGMWYRQMYGSSTRVIVSVVYVALCIVTVSMLMQGGRDIQQTSAGVGAPSVQGNAPGATAAPAVETQAAPAATPAPTKAGKSEAQMRLETFMSNWGGNRVEDMVRLVQPSWATAQESPANRLFMLLGNRTPTEYTIEEISGTDEDTSRTVTMTATIDKNNGKEPSIYRFMVLMVKEGGEWYVDPASLATNDEVKTDEGNVVNDKNATGLATEPPRTTVSPAPPASTVLYYNPDGGSFYHMDANCERIKEKYRPLQGSFSYGELAGYIKENDLQPCLACGAPTATLAPDPTAPA